MTTAKRTRKNQTTPVASAATWDFSAVSVLVDEGDRVVRMYLEDIVVAEWLPDGNTLGRHILVLHSSDFAVALYVHGTRDDYDRLLAAIKAYRARQDDLDPEDVSWSSASVANASGMMTVDFNPNGTFTVEDHPDGVWLNGVWHPLTTDRAPLPEPGSMNAALHLIVNGGRFNVSGITSTQP